MLEPEVDTRKRQTSIHRGEVHPHFDQHFKFPVSRDQLQGKELVLQVLDYDRYSHNDIIGEVRISIDEIDLSKSVEVCVNAVYSTITLVLIYRALYRSGAMSCVPRSHPKIVRNCLYR